MFPHVHESEYCSFCDDDDNLFVLDCSYNSKTGEITGLQSILELEETHRLKEHFITVMITGDVYDIVKKNNKFFVVPHE